MASPDLIEFCKTHSLKMVTVADLIRYRMRTERYVHRIGEAMLPTEHGEFRMVAFETQPGIGAEAGESHTALVFGARYAMLWAQGSRPAFSIAAAAADGRHDAGLLV